MGSQQLFIPDKIKLGLQNREDTYTKKLGYIIYYDKAGVLRKEKSWETWRDKKIDPADYDNVPTEGFVLNRPGGGGRHSWNHRNEFVRVYDPRDFEFEISIPNLLFILRECDCSRGKGLEGKFVYAWDKTELVLLPVGCEEYRASKGFTELQGTKVKAKDLVPGATYMTKNQATLTFIGRFDYFFAVNVNHSNEPERKADAKGVVKKYVFYDHHGERFIYEDGPNWPGFVYLGSPVEDWLADIKARIAKVKIGEKRKKLEDLEKRLNAIVSPELRAQLELEAIEKALG